MLSIILSTLNSQSHIIFIKIMWNYYYFDIYTDEKKKRFREVFIQKEIYFVLISERSHGPVHEVWALSLTSEDILNHYQMLL